MKTSIQIVVLLALLGALGFLAWPQVKPMLFPPPKNCFLLSPKDVDVRVQPMSELDFLSKEQVFAQRSKMVSLVPDLIGQPYAPSQEVFGRVEGGKSWWGIDGIYHYGPGKRSIEGPSEETRFINNPALLVGVCEIYAFQAAVEGYRKDVDSYPKLEKLSWDAAERTLKVRYNLWDFMRFLRRIRAMHGNRLDWLAYNARDLGYNYLYAYPDKTVNLELHQKPNTPVLIRQYLHRGGSSKYPGGSNNGSPKQGQLEFTIKRLPAKSLIALWKEEPPSATHPPDVKVLIEMR